MDKKLLDFPDGIRNNILSGNNMKFFFVLLVCYYVNGIAETICIDPGPEDTSFFYNSYEIPGALESKRLNGQIIPVDIYFGKDKQLCTKKAEIELVILQDDKMGVWPQCVSVVTGYLIQSGGTPLTEPAGFTDMMRMPAQIWPESEYRLSDNTRYIPSQTGYKAVFTGTGSKPLVFSGIHFEIKTPVISGRKIIGLRLTISNYHDFNARNHTWRNPISILQKSPVRIIPGSLPEKQ